MKIRHPKYGRGQSLVEMALLLPVLLLLSVVTLDMGRGVYYYSVIYNAAREGARYGIVHQQPYNTSPLDTVGIEAAVRKLAIGLDEDQLKVPEPVITGDLLQVTVTYKFQLVTPFARYFVSCHPGCINLTSSSTMLIER